MILKIINDLRPSVLVGARLTAIILAKIVNIVPIANALIAKKLMLTEVTTNGLFL
jgi:hypothetical protein